MKRKISKLLIAFLLIAVSICIGNTSKADIVEPIESAKYMILERKGQITRIIPETTIEEFKQKFNKEASAIHLYKDENTKEEITQGYVKTGMVVAFDGITERYKLSIIGDLNGDGELNQIDLNLLIKHVIGFSEYEEEDIKWKSAEVNGDGIINQIDITTVIRYIMEHELYIPEIVRPLSPIIEIKTEKTEEEYYKTDVEVEIKANKESQVEIEETIYKVTGTKNIEETPITDSKTITLTEDGEYIISAYSYSKEGAKSLVISKTIKINKNVEPENPILRDKENPEATIEISEVTSKSFKASIRATDNLSGIGKIIWYYKPEDEEQFTIEDNNYAVIKGDTIGELEQTKSYEYTELKNQKYYVVAEVIDVAGNKYVTETKEIELEKITPGADAITFKGITTSWTNNNIEVEAETTDNRYTIQLSKDNENWESVDNITAETNGTIYARLTDGVNYGESGIVEISKIDKEGPKAKLTTRDVSNQKMTMVAEVTDNLSGLSQIEWYYRNLTQGTEWQHKNETYTEPKGENAGETSVTKTVEIEDLPAGNYQVYAIITDVAGNKIIVDLLGEIENLEELESENRKNNPENIIEIVKDLADEDITVELSSTSCTYNGKDQTPITTVKNGERTLVEGEDYTLSYNNSTTNNDDKTTAGTITITITGKGNYEGTITTTYTIEKANVTFEDIPTEVQYVAKDETKTFTGKSNTEGTWSVTSENTANVEITAGHNQTNASNNISYKGKTASDTATQITVEFTPTDTTNYNTPEPQVFNVMVTDFTTNVENNNPILYVNGDSQEVLIGGKNIGTVTITDGSTETLKENDTAKITLNQEANKLTIEPKTAGTTSVTIKEANSGKEITINIEVKGTTIKANNANPLDVTTHVGAQASYVSLSGENAGAFSIETMPDANYVTASITGNIITITPTGATPEGTTTTMVAKEANGNQTVEIKIKVNKAIPQVTLKNTEGTDVETGSVDYNGTTAFTATVTSTPAVDGTYTVTSSRPSNVEITAGNGATATDGVATNITYKGLSAIEETTIITVMFTPSDTVNYLPAIASYTVNAVNKIPAINPTLTAYTGKYNGEEHTIGVSPSVGTNLGGIIEYSTDQTNWSESKPTRKDYGTTTVYVHVKGDDNHTTSETISSTITIDSTSMTYESGDYTGVYDEQPHSITLDVTEPEETIIYYSTETELNSSNYSTVGTTTKPQKTNVSDTGTIYWYIKSNNSNYDDISGSNTVTITPKNIAGNDIDIELSSTSLPYSGTEQKPETTVKLGETTLVEGVDYTVTYPEDATNVGEKTVTITGIGNYAGTETTVNYTITKVTPEISLNVTEGTVNYNGTTTFTITQNANPAINGKWEIVNESVSTIQIIEPDTEEEKIATNGTPTNITYKGLQATDTPSTITIKFIPTGETAGNYNEQTITYTVNAVNKVDAVNPTVTSEQIEPIVYDGLPHTIKVEPETGETLGGTIQYSTDQINWSTTKPTATNVADSKTIYVRVLGDSNHNTTTPVSANITITRANITPQVSMTGYTYGGTKSTPSISGNIENGEVTYYYNTTNSTTGGTAWSEVTSSTSINAGTYYMYAEVGETANYNRTTTTAVEFVVAKATPSVTLSAQSGAVNYNSTNTFTVMPNSNPAVNGTWTVTSSNSEIVEITKINNSTNITNPTATNGTASEIEYKGKAATTSPVTITVTFTPTDTTNCNTKQVTYTVNEVNKIQATVPQLADTTNTYDGDPHTVEVISEGSGGTIQYRASTNGGSSYGNWQTNLPTITNTTDAIGGTLYVQAQVVGDSNHTNSEIATATCHVGYASMQVTGTNYTGTYDGQAHSITVTVNKPTSGTKVYYRNGVSVTESNLYTNGTLKTEEQLNSEGITTNPADQKVTATQVSESKRIYWCVVDTTKNYSTLTGSNLITINAKNINAQDMTIGLSQTSYTYNGNAQTPTTIVTDTTRTATLSSIDYDLSYNNSTTGNDNRTTAGTITVTATGKGNYTGTTTKTYTINKANATINDIPTEVQYVAKDETKTFTGKSNTEGTWSVTSENTANVEITAGHNQTNASNNISYKGKTASDTATQITVEFTPTDTTNYNTPEPQVFNVMVTDFTTNVENNNPILYVNGDSQEVLIGGKNIGTVTITDGSTETLKENDTAKITLNQEANKLTIEPKTAGTTSVTIKEANSGKEITINIEVKGTTIKANNANPLDVTTHVGAQASYVSLSGENAGAFSIETMPDANYVTASITGNIITITPTGATPEGTTTTMVAKEANGNQTVEIKIKVNKAIPQVTLKNTEGTDVETGSVDYNGTTAFTATVTSTPAVDGTYTVTSSRPSNVEITAGNGATATDGVATNITYKGLSAIEETTIITVMFTPSDTVNYLPAIASYTVNAVNKIPAINPTLTAYTGKYNGEEHTIGVSPSVGTNLGGIIEYSTDQTNWSESKPTRKDYGTTTVYVHVKGDDNHTTSETISSTITIDSTSMTYESGDYTGVYDEQPHSITLDVTEPEETIIYYSTETELNSSNYSTVGTTTKPQKTNVSDTGTIYWYIKSNNSNYDDISGSNTVTITPKNIAGNDIDIELSSTSLPYSGTEQKPETTVKLGETTLVEGVDYTVTYPEDATNVGEKTVTITGIGNYAGTETTVNYTITKVTPEISLNVTEGTVNYNGTTTFTITQNANPAINGKWEIVNESVSTIQIIEPDTEEEKIATNGTPTNITYKGLQATDTPSTITIKFIPTGETAGNYNEQTITYTVNAVNKVDAVNPTVTSEQIEPIVYDGLPHTIKVEPETGETLGGTIQYSTDQINWSTTKPTATNVADSKTIYVRVLGDSNHNTTTPVSANITITRANITPQVSMTGYTYGGTKSTPSISGNIENGEVTYYYNTTNSTTGGTAWSEVTSSTSINAGTYYMYAEVGETANYNRTTTTAVEFVVAKATPSVTLSAQSGAVNYNSTNTFTVMPNSNPAVNGTWTVTSSNSEIVEITKINNSTNITNPTATNGTASEIEYKGKAATTSPVTITVTFTPTDTTNCNTKQVTYTVNEVNKIQATVPQLADTTNTYDGDPHTVEVISEGSGGTIQYRASTNGGSSYGNWQTNLPTITNTTDAIGGTLYVQAQVVGDSNHTNSEIATATCHVGYASMQVTGTNYTGTYDGQAHSITVTVTKPTSGTTVYYSTKRAIYEADVLTESARTASGASTTNPTATQVAESKRVYWCVVDTTKNYSTLTGSNLITINVKNINAQDMTIALSKTSYTYNGNNQTPSTTVTDTTRTATLSSIDYDLSYNNSTTSNDDRTTAGTITVTATGKGNYTGTITATYTINKANATLANIPTGTQYVAKDGTNTFTGISNVPGKWTVTSSNTTRVEITAGHNQTNASNSISYKGKTATDTATEVTVAFTPTDATNYNAPESQSFNVYVTDLATDVANNSPILYVNGSNKEVAISGTNIGSLSITDGSNDTTKENNTAKITLNQTTNVLTIQPKAAGLTNVKVKEANGNKEITINIEVKSTTIKANNQNPLSVTTYVGASSTTVTLSGDNAGTYSIETPSNSEIATATISGSLITITPVTAGSTSLVAKEANGNQTVIINITVNKATPTITLSATSGAVNYDSTASFTAKPVSTPAVNGTWSVISGDIAKVEITQGHNTAATNNTATTIKYKGKLATSTATSITITFTPSDTTNYNTATATYTVNTVNKINATNPTLTAYTGGYNGEPHSITVSPATGETLGGTIQYSTDQTNWSETNPTRTDYGTTTVYVRVQGDSNHITTTAISSTITINATSMTYTNNNYAGAYDGNPHYIDVSVTEPAGTTIYYSATTQLNANNYNTAGTTTNPGKTNVGDSGTVYWYIKSNSDNYDDAWGSNTVTITKSNATNPSLTAYTGTYDGQPHSITVSGSNLGGTIQYSTNNTNWSTTNPTRTEVGTTTVYVRVAGDSNHNTTNSVNTTITINKATPTVNLSATSGTVDYNSTTTFTAKPVSTPAVNGTWQVTSGTPANVEITAGNGANATNNTNTNITYKGKAATNTAVTITVKFTPSDTTNYNTAQTTYTVNAVNKINATNPTLTGYNKPYDGQPHSITVSGSNLGGTIQYSTDNSTWSTTNPTATNVADSKTVYVRVLGDSNHNTTSSVNAALTITRANINPTVSMAGYTYGGTKSTPSISGNSGSGTVTYYYRTTNGTTGGTNWNTVTSSTSLNAGTYYMYATIAQTANYNSATTASAVSFTIAKASPSVTLSATSGNVNYDSTTTFTAKPVSTPAVNGTWSVVSGTPANVEITAGNNATATNNTNTNITYKGKAATTTAVTITVTFNPSDTTNYNTAQKTYSVTAVNKVAATAPVLGNTSSTYDGQAHTVETTSNGSGGTLKYRSSTNNSTWSDWSETKPTITNVGTLYVQAKVVGDSNHNDSSTASATATVSASGMTYTGATNVTTTYDGVGHGLNISVSKPASGAVVYYSTTELTSSNYSSGQATSPTATNVSESPKTVYWYIKSNNSNYNDAKGSNTITINAKSITASGMTATLSQTSYTYNGSSQTPTTTVKDGTKTLTLNTDYTLSYQNSSTNNDNRTRTGTITVTITGKGNYTGTTTRTYTINKANVTFNDIPSGLQYVGKDMSKSFTARASTAGNWSVSRGDTNIDLTGGTSFSNTTEATIEYTGKTASANATTITIAFTPTDQDNYNTPQSQSFTVKATECTASPTELTLYVGGDTGTVTLGGINAGEFTILKPNGNIAQNTDYATSYSDSNITASINGTTLTVTQNAITNSPVTLTIKEGYGDKTTTVSVTVRYVKAEEVSYTPSDNSWNPGNVQNALDTLYTILQ